MIVALLNHKGGVGETTLALHLAGEWARQGRRVTLIDADPQNSALDCSQQRAREGLPRLVGVICLARDTLHREAPAIARGVDHVVIDGSRVASVMRSALLAADLILLPVQPSAFDGWASADMLTLIDEARSYRRRRLLARFVVNRCCAHTAIARETVKALTDHNPPMLRQRVGQGVAFADAAKTGRLVGEIGAARFAVSEVKAFAAEVGRIVR